MMDIATPIFGDKSHINVDQRFGFVRKWTVPPSRQILLHKIACWAMDASRYDGRELTGFLDTDNTDTGVWAGRQ